MSPALDVERWQLRRLVLERMGSLARHLKLLTGRLKSHTKTISKLDTGPISQSDLEKKVELFGRADARKTITIETLGEGTLLATVRSARCDPRSVETVAVQSCSEQSVLLVGYKETCVSCLVEMLTVGMLTVDWLQFMEGARVPQNLRRGLQMDRVIVKLVQGDNRRLAPPAQLQSSTMEADTRTISKSDRLWASGMHPGKRVLLFGGAGAGKSTVANALVTGGIVQVVFPSSDAPGGCTSEIKKESGRGWTVVDTPGLREAGTTGIISTGQSNLTSFCKNVKDEYSHIIFVQKATRWTVVDRINWLLFSQLFKGAEEAFLILFTSADGKWLEENIDTLPSFMDGVKALAVDIPPISIRRVTEKRQKETREKAITKLEEDLGRVFEQRGNKFSTPDFAQMNDAQLEKKLASLVQVAVRTIRKIFHPLWWSPVARKVSSLVSLGSINYGFSRNIGRFHVRGGFPCVGFYC